MKYISLLIFLSFLILNVKSQVINWATETGLSNGDTFVDGQVITNFAGTGLDARINVSISGGQPSVGGGGTTVFIRNENCSFTLTFLNGDRADVLLNNHVNFQQGEIITVSNPDGQKIRLQQTSNNGGGRMTVDGVTVPAINAIVTSNTNVVEVREVNNGAGSAWNASMDWVSSFTWAYASGPGTSATEGFQLTISNISPLPVTFTYVDLSSTNSNSVFVNWETASEINNEKFIIERSINTLDWEVVGETKGSQNSSSVLNYKWEDKSPYKDIASYYRVKQVDFDGKFSYSEIKSITLEENKSIEFLVYPNPSVDNFITVDLLGQSSLLSFQMYDKMGRLVTSLVNKTSIEGASTFNLDIKNLTKGVYFLKVGNTVEKIIVSN